MGRVDAPPFHLFQPQQERVPLIHVRFNTRREDSPPSLRLCPFQHQKRVFPSFTPFQGGDPPSSLLFMSVSTPGVGEPLPSLWFTPISTPKGKTSLFSHLFQPQEEGRLFSPSFSPISMPAEGETPPSMRSQETGLWVYEVHSPSFYIVLY